MIFAQSPAARIALQLVTDLQRRMVSALEAIAGSAEHFGVTSWERDGGQHGGGHRMSIADTATFDRASVNVSQVHYDDEPAKRLSSATALSAIVHPRHPRAPSFHVHVSWTEMRDGSGYWRIMADLNPSLVDSEAARAGRARLLAALEDVAPAVFAIATRQGDAYFFIPALDRHRGIAHFYLEQYATSDPAADRALARAVGEAAIDTYAAIVTDAVGAGEPPTAAELEQQLRYHTLYLFQVLTLDRGTTSGLLVHDQNDVGILGSLPSRVDRDLLASWRAHVPAPIDELVDRLLGALTHGRVVIVDEAAKRSLAAAVRAFHTAHPSALELQARGDVIPPTVANHR